MNETSFRGKNQIPNAMGAAPLHPSATPLHHAELLRYTHMRPEEMDALRRLEPVLAPRLDEILDQFYEHLLQFPTTRTYLSREGLVERLKAAQKEYFTTLLKGVFDESYIATRKLIGKTHERIGLEPRWYIGGYALFCQIIFPLIREYYQNNPSRFEEAQIALLKAFFMDMQIAMETYIDRYAGELVEARRTLEQKLWMEDRLLSFILTEASDAIVGLDDQDRISTWSQGAQRIFGYKTKEILDKSLEDLLVKPELVEHMKNTLQDKGAALLYGSDWKAKDGNVITADATLTLLCDDQGISIGSTLIVRDTTEIRRLASKVKNMEQLAAMTKVTASVAHEIRTPLGVMALTGDILSERITEVCDNINDQNREEYRQELLELVSDLQVEVDRLNEIVDHYLVLSRIKRPTKTRIHISSYMKELAADLSNRHIERPIQLQLEGNLEDVYVDVDPAHIRRVFQNLYENAFFATKNSGGVFMRIADTLEAIHIEFKDTGSGIPDELLKKLFSAFVTNKPGGTGLGLYLVREIIEAHDGTVEIESKEGQGTTIRIVLPKVSEEVVTDGAAL